MLKGIWRLQNGYNLKKNIKQTEVFRILAKVHFIQTNIRRINKVIKYIFK